MRLSDIVSHMNLAFWPQVALVIFLIVFVAVAVRVFTRPGHAYQHFGEIPLEDAPDRTPAETPRHG